MKNIKTLLIIIISLLAAYFIGWLSLFKIIQSPNTTEGQPKQIDNISTQVELQIDFGNENVNTFSYDLTDGLNAFSVLEKAAEENNLNLEIQQYDFGVFVKSINGLQSTKDVSWIYFVNGESGTIAADQFTLKAGDVVEWKYIPPTVDD